jgi:hypothetical protein
MLKTRVAKIGMIFNKTSVFAKCVRTKGEVARRRLPWLDA